MEPPSPARLYATVAGAVLLVLGIIGFFYDASFTGLDDLQPAFAAIEVNAWFNLLYLATGATCLLVAGVSSRTCSVAMGVPYTLLGIFGPGTRWLHLAIGLLGLAAFAGTPRLRGSEAAKSVRGRPRKSKARAKPAGDRA